MAAPAWPQSRAVIFDNNGVRAAGALAYFFDDGTTTPRTTYQDDALATPHAHPVVADASGRMPRIYLQYGAYSEQVTTSAGSQLWNDDGIDEPAPFDGSQVVDPDTLLNTGDTWFSPVDAIRAGAVRLNGRTIGNASSSATERANADTSDLFTFLYNNIADGQAAVSGGRGANAAADYAANKTITLMDWRAGGPIGLDTMGNTAGSFFTGLTFGSGDATTAGSAVGANTHALVEAELAAHVHDVGAIAADTHSGHTHAAGTLANASAGSHSHGGFTGSNGNKDTTIFLANSNRSDVDVTGAASAMNGGNNASVNTASAHTHTISADGSHTHTVSGSTASDGSHTHALTGDTASVGSGTAHANVSRVGLGTWYIKL